MNRCHFIATAFALSGAASLAGSEERSQPPAVTRPRAASGDSTEPSWEQQITVTVGSKRPTSWARAIV